MDRKIRFTGGQPAYLSTNDCARVMFEVNLFRAFFDYDRCTNSCISACEKNRVRQYLHLRSQANSEQLQPSGLLHFLMKNPVIRHCHHFAQSTVQPTSISPRTCCFSSSLSLLSSIRRALKPSIIIEAITRKTTT
jgi:hypothetical protein